MNPCKITEDLMPLYVENTCSEDSKAYVEQHLQECEACRRLYEEMKKSVQAITNIRNAKESFRLFKRRLLLKRILLSTACTLICLVLLTIVLYKPFENFFASHLLTRTEPFIIEVSRLSDGSISISLQYSEEDVYVNTQRIYTHPQDERTLCIELGYNRLNTWDPHLKNAGAWHNFLVITEDSAELYELDNSLSPWNNRPYDKVVLIGSDGERVIWQKGNSIPVADVYSEALLQEHLEDGYLIPVNP